MARAHDAEILRLAVPALGALAAEPLYVLADTAVVGHLGTAQLGGLAIASTLLLTGYALFIFLAYGTTASVARLLGAGDRAAAAHDGVQGLWLALVIGLGVVAVVAPLAPRLVALMGADGAVAEYALRYLRISLLGVPALLLVQAGTGYLRGLQDTGFPLAVTAVAVTANLVLELVLIYGLDQGIGASALSTVVVQIAAAWAYVRRVAADVRAQGVGVRPDRTALRRLAVVGGNLFLRTAALRLCLTVGTALAARRGAVELAAYQIAFELWFFPALVLDALAVAGQAMVGRLLGAGDVDGARGASGRMLLWGVLAGCGFALAFVALRTVLPGLFTDDPAVIAAAATLLWFVAAVQPVNALAFVLDGLLIGAGDLRFLAWAMGIAAAVYLPAAALVAVLDLGVAWLWVAIILLMVARAAVLGWRFRGSAWQVTGAARGG